MTRFFIDITQDGECVSDDTGMELADRSLARLEALKALPQIACESFHHGGDDHTLVAHVRDDAGRVLFTAHLSLIAGWVT